MSTREFAAQLKNLIIDIKAGGTAAIYCDALIEYLGELEKQPESEPSQLDFEEFKANLQTCIETHKHRNETRIELLRACIASGQAALKSAFLLNGGAAIALLAFIGHVAEGSPEKVPLFSCSLLYFSLGVLAITISSGVTYAVQYLYANYTQTSSKAGDKLNYMAMLLGGSSYALFFCGVLGIYHITKSYI